MLFVLCCTLRWLCYFTSNPLLFLSGSSKGLCPFTIPGRCPSDMRALPLILPDLLGLCPADGIPTLLRGAHPPSCEAQLSSARILAALGSEGKPGNHNLNPCGGI